MIYLVEDDESIRELVVYTLNSQGLEAQGFERPSLFWKALEKELPSLVLLDIMLPDGNGLDICRRFREKTMNPVLFLTGKSDIRDRVEGLQQGGDYYLTKPYNFDEFLAVIQMLLERQKLEIQTARNWKSE